MFYNTHVFFASKLYSSDNPLILIGSILPDVAITKIVGWDSDLHHIENSDFLKFLKNNYPLLTKFYKGIFSHCILDNFAHNSYKKNIGYAYQNNEKISQVISKYYEVDKEVAKRTAHNYLESAVDMLLLQEYPQLKLKIKNAIEEVDINLISDLLSLYFVKNKLKFRQALIEYFKLIAKSNLESLRGLILFWGDLEKMLFLKKIGIVRKKELLKLSINQVVPTYKDFMYYSFKKRS